MNKIIFTVVAILVLNLLPLIGDTSLFLHYKTWTLVIAAATLWLTQPVFSTADARQNRKSDKSSIIIILIMSSTSVLFSNLEWAYFSDDQNLRNWVTIVGLLLLAGGIFVRVWAIKTLGKHFTATARVNADHQLIQSGPYRFVRHPSYLGAFMAIVGTPIFLNNTWTVIYVIAAMSVAYYIRITAEERMLRDYFGENYVNYSLHTKRIIPFIW